MHYSRFRIQVHITVAGARGHETEVWPLRRYYGEVGYNQGNSSGGSVVERLSREREVVALVPDRVKKKDVINGTKCVLA